MPLGEEEVVDRNNRAQSQAAPPIPPPRSRASCLSQPGTSGHVSSSSCPQKTRQALRARLSAGLLGHGSGAPSSNRFLSVRTSGGVPKSSLLRDSQYPSGL